MRAALFALALCSSAAGADELLDCFPGDLALDDEIHIDECRPARALAERLGDRVQPPLEEKVTLGQLLDAERLAATLDRPAPGPQLDRAALDPLLAQTSTPEQPGWWQRVKAWLKERLTRDKGDGSWLIDLLDKLKLSAEAAEATVDFITVLLAALAAAIVLNELRLLRWKGGRLQRARRAVMADAADEAAPLSWTAITQLPAREQAAALWAYALAALAAHGVVKLQRSRTPREYRFAIERTEPPLSPAVGELSRGAEQALYGPIDIAIDTAPLRTAAERLRQSLDERAAR